MFVLKTLGLFIATAIAEIVGCYLPYLYLRDGRSAWLLVPAVLSLVVFVWLLSLHPTAGPVASTLPTRRVRRGGCPVAVGSRQDSADRHRLARRRRHPGRHGDHHVRAPACMNEPPRYSSEWR